MEYLWLNAASILLGAAALALPVAALAGGCAGVNRGWFVGASFLCCSLSLLAVLRYGLHLVQIGDWSAIQDTADAFWLAGAGLISLALALNALVLAGSRHRKHAGTNRPTRRG